MKIPSDLNQVDPQWAWSPFEPDAEQPWDRRLAAHLYRRAGFAASEQQLHEAVTRQPLKLVEELVARGPDEAFEQQMRRLTVASLAGGDTAQLPSVWLYRMLATPNQLLEKTTLFWHGHFATSAAKVEDVFIMQQQNDMLRRHALGPFAPLVREISRDPAMLVYLDSVTNRKSHPNENYAREVMELFCLGEGNYTEHDIQELARCFTGWEVRRGKFRFNEYQHDFGEKTILGQRGELDGGEAVDVVVSQPAAPLFLARKLVRYFVCDEPTASDELLAPLARDFREHDLNTEWLVPRILSSRLFFSPLAMGRKIRSPVELAVGLLRALEGTTNVVELSEQLSQLGQHLFFPPNVKGWDGGRNWINSSTLLGRANLVQALLQSGKTRFGGGTLAELAARYERAGTEQFVDWMAELLLAVPLPVTVRGDLIAVGKRSQAGANAGMLKIVHALSTLPEFQLG